MKKYLLSAFVTFSFIFYSIGEKNRLAITSAAITPPPVIDNKTSLISGSPEPTNKVLNSPSVTSGPVPTIARVQSGYRDGEFVGNSTDAFYGYIQVSATTQNGRITDVNFLQYPNDRGHSIMINNYALPILRQEAIQIQNAKVDIVTGATDTSIAFIQSLSSALAKAN